MVKKEKVLNGIQISASPKHIEMYRFNSAVSLFN